MSGLGDVIATKVAAWGDVDLPLERALFGTTDPEEIATSIDAFCVEHLGAGIAGYRFFDSSSGSVHGVELSDGRAVVVKGHRAGVDVAYLQAIDALRTDLADAGYPAPRPLAGPTPCGAGRLTAEELRPRSVPDDPGATAVVHALASGLAGFVAAASPHRDRLAGLTAPMAVPDGAWYPTPHSDRFDFAATASGAEWIDALAADARLRLARHPDDVVVGHGDWRLQNVSVRDGEVDAVYDWDSVAVMAERTAVAVAATTFTVDWETATPRFPTPEQTAAFVAAYASARGRPLTVDDDGLVAAEMVAAMSYGARCEHADPTGTRTDQRDRLRALGPGLLADGLGALSVRGR